MNQDYKNRNDWLAKRCTPRGQSYARVIWYSLSQGTYVRTKQGPIGQAARRRESAP